MNSPRSILLLNDPDAPRQAVAELVHCVHCHRMWPVAGSIAGIARGELNLGYCAKCDGIHCPECSDCKPHEQQLDQLERLLVAGG
jgi:hypothetical protein